MAQGDTIQARVGDLVEVSFTLDFKKTAVNRLPNKQKFAEIGFSMTCDTDGKALFGEPQSVPVTQDDQQITAIFSFGTGGPVTDPSFFKAGEKWTIHAGYCAAASNGPEPADEILLGHVQLVAP